MVSPSSRRRAVEHVREKLPRLSERRACRALGVARSLCRYRRRAPQKDVALTKRMRALSSRHPRLGCLKIGALLRADGFVVNKKRIERLWRQEGLAVP